MENKEKLVRKIANRIIRKYDLEVPINFERIFKEKGISYVEECLCTNGDGYSELRKNKLQIVINSDIEYIPRKRFTVAHELGHIFIGWHDDVTICQTDNEYVLHNMLDIQEKEANVFASELLMPTDWVKSMIAKSGCKRIDSLVQELSNNASTSVMAAFYALENALSSGIVFVVYIGGASYGKKFVAKKTMEIYLRGIEFEESCAILCTDYKEYDIGPYKVKYYEFCECPDNRLILEKYEQHDKNLVEMLRDLSNNHLLGILHCIRNILNVISEKYIIYLYKGEDLLLQVKSEGIETVIAYAVSSEDITIFCIENEYEYQCVEVETGYKIIVIKERMYIDPQYWKTTQQDSKILLRKILGDLYYDEEQEKIRMSISGIIGSANSQRKIESAQQMYDILYKRLNRLELCEVVKHEDYNIFLSLKSYELFQRCKDGKCNR